MFPIIKNDSDLRKNNKNTFMCIHTWNFVSFSVDAFSSQKERKLLQNKRLDLDAAKNRLKKARVADARSSVSILYTYTHTERINLKD